MAPTERQLERADFPALLLQIPERQIPKALYLRGELPPPHYRFLCVVGSRACSPYGRRQTQKIIAGLAGYPVAIVSGLALGIDGEALKAACDAGLPAVAILPSSCDDSSIYPATNRAIAARIVKEGGCLISESKSPYRPALYDFPKRDRLMAGISHCSLIIEAGEKSGTLITARLALDYNREVLAVPHELDRASGAGVNRLIREGATLVRSADDVLQALGLTPLEKPKQMQLPTDLSDEEAKVFSALSEALVRDELMARTELSAQEANIALSSLLIRGLITERLGKIERC